jgi:hypothetical protein
VPVDNFYECKKTGTGKQPHAIALADRQIMALAGLWETWRSKNAERIRSFAIVTTTPNELCAEIHNRMPVVLAPQAWPIWLSEQPAEFPELKALLAPCTLEGVHEPVWILDWRDRAGLSRATQCPLCFEHPGRTRASAGWPRCKSRGESRQERQYRE